MSVADRRLEEPGVRAFATLEKAKAQASVWHRTHPARRNKIYTCDVTDGTSFTVVYVVVSRLVGGSVEGTAAPAGTNGAPHAGGDPAQQSLSLLTRGGR